MKKVILPFVALVLSAVVSAGLQAAESPTEAKILKITGPSARVQLPGGETRAIQVGESLPQGATIVTGPGTQVYVAPFPGAVSTVEADSTLVLEHLSVTTDGAAVTKQNALLNLKSGNLVSNLDPAKKAINNYGVRTPKGVAAARGTVYTVMVGANSYTVTLSLSGEVSVAPVGGGAAVSLLPGNASENGGAAVAASSIPAAVLNQAVATALSVAAVVAADPANFEVAGNTAAAELSAAIKTITTAAPQTLAAAVELAAAASPASAASIVSQAVTAAAAAGQDVAAVAQAVTKAAATGASSTNPNAAVAIAQQIAQAATSAAASSNQSADTMAGIAQAAAQGAVQGAAKVNVVVDPGAAANASATGASSGSGNTVTPTQATPPAAPGNINQFVTPPVIINPNTIVVSPST